MIERFDTTFTMYYFFFFVYTLEDNEHVLNNILFYL